MYKRIVSLKAGVLAACACFFVLGARAQDSLTISNDRYAPNDPVNNDGHFAIGIAAESYRKHYLPYSIQGEYLKRNWFTTATLTFSPLHFESNPGEDDGHKEKEQYLRLSLMGGIKLDRQKKFEVSAGYTVRYYHFLVHDNYPDIYKLDEKGMRFIHFISLNTGYRFTLGKRMFLKPEISLNYRLAANIFYSKYEIEYYAGYLPASGTFPANYTRFLYNFYPYLRLSIGYVFGK